MENNNPLIKLASQLKKLLNIEFLEDLNLLTSTTIVNLIKGQVLFHQGENAQNCFLVISGNIKIVMTTKKSESIVAIISKGEIGGALLMTNPSVNYPGSVIAATQSQLLIIPKDTYNNYWMKHPEAVKYINICVRQRMLQLQEDKSLQTYSVELRVMNFLNRHYKNKNDLLTKKITRKEISLAVGAKTETVIRTLKNLERQGVIKIQGSAIYIINELLLNTMIQSSLMLPPST